MFGGCVSVSADLFTLFTLFTLSVVRNLLTEVESPWYTLVCPEKLLINW
jgi:hypothetical protein